MSEQKYDTHELKKMSDKGILDSPLDSAILSQSDEEREKLQNALEKQKKVEEVPQEKKDIEPPSPKKQKVQEKHIPFILKIIYFLQALLFGKKTPYTNKFLIKRELKKLIYNFDPIFYDVNIQKLNESFPYYIHDIYQNLRKFTGLFKEVFIQDQEIHFDEDILFVDFIENLLKSDDKMLIDSVNNSYFREIIATEQNPEQILNQKLKKVREQLEQYNQQTIIQYTKNLEKFLLLTQFSFIKFFQIFDKHFTNDIHYRPKFQPVFGAGEVEQIKELNSFLLTIDFDSVPENILMHLDNIIDLMRIRIKDRLQDKEISIEQKNKLEMKLDEFSYKSQSIKDLNEMITKINKKKILEAIIKLMTDNFDYESSHKPKREGLLFKRYIKIIGAKKLQLYKKSYESIKKGVIQKQVLDFFGISDLSELISIENYNDEIKQQLEEKGVGGFDYVLIISIHKTFYEKVYKPTMSKIINLLLVEGDFIKKREHANFSEAYYQVDKTMEKFQLLQSEIEKGERDMGSIIKFAYATTVEAGFHTIVQRKIGELEGKINDIFTELISQYEIISQHLASALEDAKSSNPQFVANMKTIGSTGNKTFINNAIKSADILKKLIELMHALSIEK